MLGSWGVVVEGLGVVSGQSNDEEGVKVLKVIIWVEGAVLEYEPRCVATPPRENFDYVSARRGGARMTIQRKILCWKQYEGDVCGGTMQRRVLMCWPKAGER